MENIKYKLIREAKLTNSYLFNELCKTYERPSQSYSKLTIYDFEKIYNEELSEKLFNLYMLSLPHKRNWFQIAEFTGSLDMEHLRDLFIQEDLDNLKEYAFKIQAMYDQYKGNPIISNEEDYEKLKESIKSKVNTKTYDEIDNKAGQKWGILRRIFRINTILKIKKHSERNNYDIYFKDVTDPNEEDHYVACNIAEPINYLTIALKNVISINYVGEFPARDHVMEFEFDFTDSTRKYYKLDLYLLSREINIVMEDFEVIINPTF